MKFCQECGHELANDAAFCTNCGNKMDTPDYSQQEQPTTTPVQPPIQQQVVPPVQQTHENRQQEPTEVPQQPTPVKEPMGKGKKVLLSLIAVIVVALVGTHLFLSHHYDPAKKIEAMNDAYNNSDANAFYALFEVPKETNGTAENFFDAVKDIDWTSLHHDLTNQVNLLQDHLPRNPIPYAGSDFIRLTSKPILFGLYDDVSFEIIPLNTSVEVPFKNMEVKIGDQTLTSKEDDEVLEIGTFIPGTYDWSFELSRNEMKMNNKGTVELYADEDNQTVLSPDWGFERISIYSEVDDATIYVNDKSTKQKISGHGELYPVILDEDAKIQLVAKNDKGKEVKSEKVALDDTSISLSFEHIEKEKAAADKQSEVEQVFYNFRQDYEDAIYTLNFDYIRDYFKPDSKMQKDYRKFIEDHETIAGYNYDFRTNEVTDVKALKDDQYELKSFETFYYSSDEEGTIYYERTKKYVISEKNDTYCIESIDNLTTDKQKQ